jgi:Ca-activated chloride channel family protein
MEVSFWKSTLLCAGMFGMMCVCRAQAPIERRPVQQAPLPTLKLESRLVTVAVNAVDAQGAPVGGLEQKDFRLLEDGREQKIAFFDKESTTPLSIVLAVDGSESVLRNERLEMQAAKKFVNTLLRPQDELDLMGFADDVTEFVAFTNDKKKIEAGLGQFQRGDATAVYNAIYLASQRLGETSQAGGRRRVLVLITDGGDTVHGVKYGQALEQAQRAGVMVYSLIVIPIYADAGRNTGGEHALIQMADDTGGKYFYVEDAKDLAPAFQKVSDDLRTQYVLGYYAPEKTPLSRPDGFRALKVQVTDPELAEKISLRYRSGYYASKQ